MDDDLFRKIIAAVRPFDAWDLLVSVAALQLIPANVSSTVRLEVLTHAIATHQVERTRKKAHGGALQRLTNNDPLADFSIVRREDPPEWHFTEPLVWRGSHVSYFLGFATTPYSLSTSNPRRRHRAGILSAFRASFRNPPNDRGDPSSQFGNRATGRTKSLEECRLSRRQTRAPAMQELERLRRCVLFDRTELDQLLPDLGGSAALASFTTECGSVQPSYDQHTGTLLAKPIVREGDAYVVALPGRLLEAARHQILSIASVAGAIHDIGERTAKRCGRRL